MPSNPSSTSSPSVPWMVKNGWSEMAAGASTASNTAARPDANRSIACIADGPAIRATGWDAVAITAATSPNHIRSGRIQWVEASNTGPSGSVHCQLSAR